MRELVFGTAGIPRSTKQRSTVSGIERAAELGLGAMEMEFVRGVNITEAIASQVAEAANRTGITLSAHAPYYINFNAHQPEKIIASQQRLLKAARIAALCGARNIVFHAAFYLGDPPQQTYNTVRKYLSETLNQLKGESNPVWLRPEVTGRVSQFGTVDEILNLCAELEGLAPCIDFAHWHARTGRFNSYPEFAATLEQIKQRLGSTALDNMHVHISGIAYGEKGEIKHLNLQESDLRYTELLQAFKDYDAKGRVICESPNLEEDAQLLQTTYNSLSKTAPPQG
ncbi:MAG: TIM barrel protein [Dehalococcoidales bacterium]|nr:TIM barrel protein [Dehalococcoidales bacterium]